MLFSFVLKCILFSFLSLRYESCFKERVLTCFNFLLLSTKQLSHTDLSDIIFRFTKKKHFKEVFYGSMALAVSSVLPHFYCYLLLKGNSENRQWHRQPTNSTLKVLGQIIESIISLKKPANSSARKFKYRLTLHSLAVFYQQKKKRKTKRIQTKRNHIGRFQRPVQDKSL